MNGLPRIAIALMDAFDIDSALVGDLDESARAGRSRLWCWLQVASVLWSSSCRLVWTRPVYSVRGIAVGWLTLLATFALVDAPILNRLRLSGYQTGEWTPFWAATAMLSYVGFALSAWVVARSHRQAPGVVVVYAVTVLIGIGSGALLTAMYPEPLPVPHVLFPLLSVALPYQWRSGLILAPAVMLVVGAMALRLRRASAPR